MVSTVDARVLLSIPRCERLNCTIITSRFFYVITVYVITVFCVVFCLLTNKRLSHGLGTTNVKINYKRRYFVRV